MMQSSIFQIRRLRAAATVLVSILCTGTSAVAQQDDRLEGIVSPVVATKPLKLGVTLVHLNDDFWKGIAYGIVDEAKRGNVTIVQVSIAGAYGNVTQQFSQIETLRSLGADYVVLGAAAFKGYDSQLKRLKDAGVGVIAAGVPVDSDKVNFGVTQDDTAIGIALAEEICKANGGKTSTVLTVPGPAGAEWARLRHDGFIKKLGTCSGLKVVEGAVGGALGLERGLSQTSDLLQKTPEARYVYTPQISLGLGAVQAARQAGSEAQVVSSSVVREAIPLVKNGKILAMGSEPGIVMGRLIVQYAIREHEKLPMTGDFKTQGTPYPAIYTPNTMITKQNVDTFPIDLYELPPKDWSLTAVQ